jgi:hypothetical protein
MRHLWRTAAAAMLVTACVAGRAEAQGWGIKGGVNLGDVQWGSQVILDTKMSISPVGGAFWRWKPAKFLDLQIEGLVSQLVIDFSEEGSELKHVLTYAQAPVVWKYTIVHGETVQVRAHGGASFDFVVLAKDDVNGEKNDIKDTVAPWMASLVAGAEVDWHRWVFDVRYLVGITDIYVKEVAADFPAKQRSIQITAGFRF